MSWELDFEREETIEDILRQAAGLCGSFQKGEEAVLKLKKAYSAVYGLGERFNGVNQKGKRVHGEVVEKFCHQGEISYCPVQFFMTDAGFGFFTDTRTVVDYVFEEEITITLRKDHEGKFPKGVLLTGTISEMLQEYVRRTGAVRRIPRWSLGIWMSANRWHTEKEVLEQVERAEKLEFPGSVLVVEAWSDEATFYRFNEHGEWPHPEEMVRTLKEKGIHTVLWQIPVLKKMEEGKSHPVLEEDIEYAVKHDLCVKNQDGSLYRIPEDHWFGGSLLPDFSRKETRDWWFSKRQYLLDMGVDGFKTDGGEFVLTDEAAVEDGRTGKELRNAFAEDYIRAYEEFVGPERVLFSRAGYTGQQRFPIQWAGDQQSEWSELRGVLSAGLSAGLSGIVYWSFDIGGFAGPLPTAELYERATQLAVFMPVMQWHSEPVGGQFAELMPSAGGINDRSPWNLARIYGDEEFLGNIKKLHNLRMNFLPYLAWEAERSAREGLPMARHLCLDYQEEPYNEYFEREFLLGDLLICPVVEEGMKEITVYLPKGKWYPVSSVLFGNVQEEKEVFYEGSTFYVLPVKEHGIPVFLREGGMFALELPKNGKPGERSWNIQETELCIWVAGEKGERNCSDGNGETLHISWGTEDIQAVYRKKNTEKDCKKIWLK